MRLLFAASSPSSSSSLLNELSVVFEKAIRRTIEKCPVTGEIDELQTGPGFIARKMNFKRSVAMTARVESYLLTTCARRLERGMW